MANRGLSLVGGGNAELAKAAVLAHQLHHTPELEARLAPRETPDFVQAGVHFDGDSHRYTFNGEPVVNVTSVLRAHKISANWDRMGVAPDVLDRKRDLGLAVHAATHYQDQGLLDPTYFDVAPAVAPYAFAWAKFRAELQFEPWLLETRLVDPLRRDAGTIDRFGVLWALGGIPGVVDLKTGDPEDAGAAVQTAAYEQLIRALLPEILAHLEATRPGTCPYTAAELALLPWPRHSVQLLKNGNYQLFPYSSPRDLQRFNWALSLEASAHSSWRD